MVLACRRLARLLQAARCGRSHRQSRPARFQDLPAHLRLAAARRADAHLPPPVLQHARGPPLPLDQEHRARRQAHNDAREEQLKLLHIAKLSQMRTLWLNRIEKRIHQIEKLLRDRLAHGGTASPSAGRRRRRRRQGAAGKGVGDRAGVAAADGSPSPPLERPLDARRLLLEGKPQTAGRGSPSRRGPPPKRRACADPMTRRATTTTTSLSLLCPPIGSRSSRGTPLQVTLRST